MAYKDFDSLSLDGAQNSQGQKSQILNGDADRVELPDASYVRDADFTRDGMDLVLDGPEGQLVIKDYFADETQPNLVAPDGSTLTPELVNSFTKGSPQYAANDTQSDESPVGAVQEVTGNATVTHVDGTTETIANGTPIYQGDIIETDAAGAVNIKFVDENELCRVGRRTPRDR
jgi:VCBS repeat-containing protein